MNLFSLEGATMFDSYIEKCVSREKELNIRCAGKTYTGFVSGMDQEWLQITTSDTQTKHMLSILNGITEVSETGRTVRNLSPASREAVRSYTQLVRKKAQGDN